MFAIHFVVNFSEAKLDYIFICISSKGIVLIIYLVIYIMNSGYSSLSKGFTMLITLEEQEKGNDLNPKTLPPDVRILQRL